ncbi:trna-specific trna nucleotidyltransferase [Moniliophthora roreri]|nr:trna-specific trna nucleotidyltransferase [Moniliophthora roreri]
MFSEGCGFDRNIDLTCCDKISFKRGTSGSEISFRISGMHHESFSRPKLQFSFSSSNGAIAQTILAFSVKETCIPTF